MTDITKIDAFVQSSPHPAWLATSRGECLYVNPALERLIGLKSDQISQLDWRSFVLEQDRAAASAFWQQSLASGTPLRATVRLRGFDGVPATVELNAFGHTLNDGMELWLFTGLHVRITPQRSQVFEEQLQATPNVIPANTWIGVNLDIDDRKRTEEMVRQSERDLRTIVETIPALIHSARPDGYLDFFNLRWLEYVGLPLEDLLGWKWMAAIHPADVEGLVDAWRRVLATGEELGYEARTRRADGKFRWMLHRKVPYRDERGNIVKWFGSSVDIDDIKRAEAKLQKSEAFLAEAQRLSHTGSFGWNPDTGEIVWSNETYRIFEYDYAENPTLDMLVRRLHPQDRASFQQVIDRASQTGTGFEHEYRLLLVDGRVKHVHAIAHALQDGSGSREFIGAVSDITERTMAEEKIRRSEKELHTLIEAIPAFVGTSRPDGSVDFISQSWQDYSGQTREEAMECGWMGRVHPDDLDRTLANWRAALAAGTSLDQEGRLRNADGTYRWFLSRDIPLRDENGNVIKWYGILFDIDEIKNWETKLRRVIDAIPTLAFCSFADGSKEFVNKRWLDYTGLSPKESHGWGWQVAVHPDDLPLLMRKWEEVLFTGKRGEIEARLRRYDGVYRWFLNRVEPFLDDTGKIVRWYGTSTDIDVLKKTETALQTREHELLGIIETIPSMLWSTSPTGEVTHISQRVLEYTGLSLEDFLNLGWKRIIHPDDLEDTAKAFFSAIQTGESYNAIHRLRRRDGEYRWYRASGEPLRDPHGKIIQWYGLSIDIDERKRAEDHLRDTRIKLAKASRLATVAELAGSIAHELSQPLMSILANAQAANKWFNAVPPNVTEVNSSIARIVRDARAADETMQHIRALFKQESFDKKDVNIPDTLREVVRVVQEDPKKRDIPIECHFEGTLPALHIDQIQTQQVFINLILNAIEALDGQQTAPLIVVRATADANRMLIQIIDNGPGVDDPDRIFDAFMTTKETGMGMGLAVSRTIVEAHGGELWAENNKAGGAIFNVTLPLSHASPTTV